MDVMKKLNVFGSSRQTNTTTTKDMTVEEDPTAKSSATTVATIKNNQMQATQPAHNSGLFNRVILEGVKDI